MEDKKDKRAYVHVSKRMKERFGTSLSEKALEDMEDCVRAGYFPLISEQRGRRIGLYRVAIGKKMAAVAYDRETGKILTVMPIEWTGRAYRQERERALAEAEVAVENTTEKGE